MTEKTWINDDKGNRCSIECWGSEERAREALETLDGCYDCSDCSRCSDCSDCSGCSRCSRCSDCSGCSRCSRCSDCSDCSRCSDCSGCSRCSRCSDCSRCSRCSGCSRCSRCSDCSRCSRCSGCSRCSDCSDCSDCSRCSDCSGCSRCSRCSDCSEKVNLNKTDNPVNSIPIPVIADIHKAVYTAASRPDALDMNTWHTCEKTHCRAGWVIALAGKEGRELEDRYNTSLAAMMIYDASTPESYRINPCRFFDNNNAALADMKALAEAE